MPAVDFVPGVSYDELWIQVDRVGAFTVKDDHDIHLLFNKELVFRFAGALYLLSLQIEEMYYGVSEEGEFEYMLDTLTGMINVFTRTFVGRKELEIEFIEYAEREFNISFKKVTKSGVDEAGGNIKCMVIPFPRKT